MTAFWTILHGLLAIALIGAVTHQCLAMWRRPGPATLFVDRFRAVHAVRFSNAVVILYVATFVLGGYIYPAFVLQVKGEMIAQARYTTFAFFQLKEHLAVIGLGLLPVYLHSWKNPGTPLGATASRRFLTTFLTFCVWWSLIAGHVLNNAKGLS